MARTKKTADDSVLTMTQEAYDALVKELTNRKEVLRPEIAEEISDARELGDLSENHAYTVAMEKKEMNENKINELEGIIAVAKIAHESKSDDFVSVGESVEIQNTQTNEKKIITLVGSEESKSANPLNGMISVDSPIGKAIYNSKIGDVVDVVLPAKTIPYKIVKFAKVKVA